MQIPPLPLRDDKQGRGAPRQTYFAVYGCSMASFFGG